MQECRQFFEKFFNLFDGIKDSQRHLNEDRKYAIGIPKTGSKLEDLEQIKKCIAKIVMHPEYSENIRPVWALFEHILQKMKKKEKIIKRELLKNYINDYREEFRMNDEELSKMLNFLHRAGFLLYFEEDKLKESIILDFQWFVDAFKYIIMYPVGEDKPTDVKRKQFQFTGELSDEELNSIWETFPNKGKGYFVYKNEILCYMERLGLLAACFSKTSKNPSWYYIPSMNKRKFDRSSEDVSKSSILCFMFDEHGQLPLFVFYGVVLECFKIPNWSILTEKDGQKCIYGTAACFSFENHIVVICVCGFQIQVQVWRTEKKDIGSTVLRSIQQSLENIMRKYKKYKYSVGYKCQNGIFHDEKDKSFIKQENFPVIDFLCKTCEVAKKHDVSNEVWWVG